MDIFSLTEEDMEDIAWIKPTKQEICDLLDDNLPIPKFKRKNDPRLESIVCVGQFMAEAEKKHGVNRFRDMVIEKYGSDEQFCQTIREQINVLKPAEPLQSCFFTDVAAAKPQKYPGEYGRLEIRNCGICDSPIVGFEDFLIHMDQHQLPNEAEVDVSDAPFGGSNSITLGMLQMLMGPLMFGGMLGQGCPGCPNCI